MSDIFISYSRKDIAFARLLYQSLGESKLETWIDWARIPAGEKWWDEICAAIEGADVFLFVISRHAVGSSVCKDEIGQALSHNKRIIPILVDDTTVAAIHKFAPELAAINWIQFRQDEAFRLEVRDEAAVEAEERVVALPAGPQFRAALEKLSTAIHTDWAWVKAHTRLETRAREWERRGREGSLLLRGNDLRDAEQLLAQARNEKDPQPTDLQRQYVLASRRSEDRRQRLTLGAVAAGLVIALILAFVAWTQRNSAVTNLARSESLRLAGEAEDQLTKPDGSVETAALLSIRALRRTYTPQAEAALVKSMPLLYAVRTFSGHEDIVMSVAFSPDGMYVLTGSNDGTAKLWDTDFGDTIRLACSRLTRDLLPEERVQYDITEDTPTCPAP